MVIHPKLVYVPEKVRGYDLLYENQDAAQLQKYIKASADIYSPLLFFTFTYFLLFFMYSYPLVFTLLFSSWLFSVNHALPLSNTKLQTVFYQEQTTIVKDKDWFMSQEYDMFSSVTDYYENIVDSTLSSQSEELLLNLIHLNQGAKERILQAQAHYLGIELLSEKQLAKMPSIIGKHVQAMNTKVYDSIENTLTLYWHTIWDPKLLSESEDDVEDHILSFLSSFNSIVAKSLMDQIEEYQLLQQIRYDVLNVDVDNEEQAVVVSFFDWIKSPIDNLFSTKKPKQTIELEDDFLRQHLTDIRTNLLMELHIQFMDFFARVQTDIIEQLSTYYNQ